MVARVVQTGASKIPGKEFVAEAYASAAKGLMDFTTGNGIRSVSLEGSIQRHQSKGHEVQQSQDFLRLDLRQCDELLPNRKRLHSFAAIAEGAAASLLITGAEISATVSGGTTAPVALGTLAVDSVFVMAGLGRVVAEVAVCYGFDPNLPEEELFALQVLGLGMAVGSGAKTTALVPLCRASAKKWQSGVRVMLRFEPMTASIFALYQSADSLTSVCSPQVSGDAVGRSQYQS